MSRRVTLAAQAELITTGLAAVRAELRLREEFPPDVLAAAADGARVAPGPAYADATGVPLLTVDPPGSRDLDQAFGLARTGGGYRLHYAIADPGCFAPPGGPVTLEALARGVTYYGPDGRVPLYPPVLGEDAASLLPDGDRPAVLWTLELDRSAEPVEVGARRALVRSRARLDYAEVQRALDRGTAEEPLVLLREVGLLRLEAERARGGVSLPSLEQEVAARDGGFALAFRTPLPVEDWNAQLSLLTGMAAARLMRDAGVGLLRTMPPPDPRAVAALHRGAGALGVPWPAGRSYPDFVRGLDPSVPAGAALLALAATLLRGAGYTAFDGGAPAARSGDHAAVAAPYAHATAPLRRVADRYVSEVALAVSAGTAVPEWVRAALPGLPAVMSAAAQRERELERAVLNLVESVVLAGRVGQVFEAAVVEANGDGGTLLLRDPAVRAPYRGVLPLGELVPVRLVTADPASRRVEFAPA